LGSFFVFVARLWRVSFPKDHFANDDSGQVHAFNWQGNRSNKRHFADFFLFE